MSYEVVFVLRVLGLMAVAILVGSGYWLAVRSMFPRFTERSSQRWRSPLFDLFVGLLLGVPMVYFGRNMANSAGGQVPETGGNLLVGLALILGVVGLAGLASYIGNGLKVPGEDHNSWKATLRGGIVIGLLAGLPILGQNVVLPLLLAGGLGNALMSIRNTSAPKSRVQRPREAARTPIRSTPLENDREGSNRRSRPPRRGRPPRPREDRERSGSDKSDS
jgi:hypothetical protein